MFSDWQSSEVWEFLVNSHSMSKHDGLPLERGITPVERLDVLRTCFVEFHSAEDDKPVDWNSLTCSGLLTANFPVRVKHLESFET